MKRIRFETDQKPDAVPYTDTEPTGKFQLHTLQAMEVLNNTPTQKLKPVSSEIQEMFGKACRDCINLDFDLNLSKDDCKYEKHSDGHRKVGMCKYCGRNRPIVMGLKISGRIKMRFS